jgi:hypothetical protein
LEPRSEQVKVISDFSFTALGIPFTDADSPETFRVPGYDYPIVRIAVENDTVITTLAVADRDRGECRMSLWSALVVSPPVAESHDWLLRQVVSGSGSTCTCPDHWPSALHLVTAGDRNSPVVLARKWSDAEAHLGRAKAGSG